MKDVAGYGERNEKQFEIEIQYAKRLGVWLAVETELDYK